MNKEAFEKGFREEMEKMGLTKRQKKWLGIGVGAAGVTGLALAIPALVRGSKDLSKLRAKGARVAREAARWERKVKVSEKELKHLKSITKKLKKASKASKAFHKKTLKRFEKMSLKDKLKFARSRGLLG